MSQSLETKGIKPIDALTAYSLTLGSKVLSRLPPKMNVIQNPGTPSFTPLYWHKAHGSLASIGGLEQGSGY